MSISPVSSRKFNTSFNPTSSASPTSSANPTSSATKPAPAAKTPEMGPPSGRQGIQFQDTFDTGSPSSSSNGVSGAGPGSRAFGDKLHHALESAGVEDETIKTVLAGLNGGSPAGTTASGEGGEDAVDGASPGSRAFGDKLHHALESAGVEDETIKTVLAGLNGGGSPDGTTASGEGGEDSVGGVTPGSRAFGDKLHHALKSAGVEDETIKTVLAGLNGGQPASGQSDATGLDTLMSQLDGDSSNRLLSDGDSLEQLSNNPELTAQLAQAPELFKMLMNQQS